MQEHRQHFRYMFPETAKTVCTDNKGRRLIPIDISDGGIGFYAEVDYPSGSVEEIHLLEFMTIKVKVNHSVPGGRGDGGGKPLFKIGAEFVDYNLTPQKLIEFLEVNMLKGSFD